MSKISSGKYYLDNKEKLQKEACERYEIISKDEKEKKGQYVCTRFKDLSEDEKQKLV